MMKFFFRVRYFALLVAPIVRHYTTNLGTAFSSLYTGIFKLSRGNLSWFIMIIVDNLYVQVLSALPEPDIFKVFIARRTICMIFSIRSKIKIKINCSHLTLVNITDTKRTVVNTKKKIQVLLNQNVLIKLELDPKYM